MPEAASTRLGLIGPTGATDPVADGDDVINAIIAQLEGVAVGFMHGMSRPAASSALTGYFYMHTGTGVVSYCTGSTWINDLQSGSHIGYDEVTADVSVGSSTEATGTTVITCTAYIFDGTPVMAEFFCPYWETAGAQAVVVSLFEGATQIGRLAVQSVPGFVSGKMRFTPSAAGHTYKVTAHRTAAGGNTLKAGAGGTGAYAPMFIRFTRA